MGGYFVGSATHIPALDYFTASDERANWTWAFERDNRMALRPVETSFRRTPESRRASNDLKYKLADIRTWANLGLHLAEKLRDAVALQTYRLTDGEENRQAAIQHLEPVLVYWEEVIAITLPIYKDMRLTHYNHNFFEANEETL